MALNDISLTSSMRSNLIALQNTATLLSRTQDRLSTGKKVNTALDNPTNFFAAQANSQRANDLSTRKDAMTEAVQGVDAANKGITAITSLIEAAKGLTQAARSADTTNRRSLASQFNEVRNQISQMASDSSYKGKNFLTGDSLNVLFNESGSSLLVISGFDSTASGLSITGLTIGAAASSTAGATGVVGSTTATTAGSGVLVSGVATGTTTMAAGVGYHTGGTFWAPTATGLVVSGLGTSGVTDVMSGMELFAAAYYGNASFLAGTGNYSGAAQTVSITNIYVSGIALQTGAAHNIWLTGSYASGNLAVVAVNSGFGFTGIDGTLVSTHTGQSVSFQMTVTDFYTGGQSPLKFYLGAGGVTGQYTGITDVMVSGQVVATGSFSVGNDASGDYIQFTGLAVPPTTVAYNYSTPATRVLQTSGNYMTLSNAYATGTMDVYVSGILKTAGTDYTGSGTTLILNSGLLGSGTLVTTANRVFDLGVSGTGFDLTQLYVGGSGANTGYVVSNSGGENFLTFNAGQAPIAGEDLSFDYTQAAVAGSWDSDTGIDASVSGLNTAIETLRTKSANLASNLSVVTIREDFTDGLVNTLLKGADNLTLADMNQEGANMLMLQTRQQLGTTSLKMASDAAQSVLRLF